VTHFDRTRIQNPPDRPSALLRGLADELLTLSPGALDIALIDGALEEICDGCEAH
jgi:hypothetical protein